MSWIPVRGNPPPEDMYVLTWQPRGVPLTAMIIVTPDGRGLWYTQTGYLNAPPTHWMPLPEPPREEG